jgi:WD40 repeat protein
LGSIAGYSTINKLNETPRIISCNYFLSAVAPEAQPPQLVLPVGHTSSFGSLYFSPDGSKLATTAFKDQMVAVWDVQSVNC